MRTYIINKLTRGIFFLFLVLMLTACTSREDIVLEMDSRGNEAESAPETEGEPGAEAPDIFVHICGAVEKPGVYILAAGSRVYEGVAAAGGFREDACEDFINQAGILLDGQRLVIPTEEEAEAAGMAENSAGRTDGLININTATESELSGIPGIGAGKAAAIVQYRQENGNFASVEDIMKVSGIKEGTFEKIKDKITVN